MALSSHKDTAIAFFKRPGQVSKLPSQLEPWQKTSKIKGVQSFLSGKESRLSGEKCGLLLFGACGAGTIMASAFVRDRAPFVCCDQHVGKLPPDKFPFRKELLPSDGGRETTDLRETGCPGDTMVLSFQKVVAIAIFFTQLPFEPPPTRQND